MFIELRCNEVQTEESRAQLLPIAAEEGRIAFWTQFLRPAQNAFANIASSHSQLLEIVTEGRK